MRFFVVNLNCMCNIDCSLFVTRMWCDQELY